MTNSMQFASGLSMLAVLLALAAPVAAQTVYRCGGSYSDEPCPGAAIVAVADPRSREQQLQTTAATHRDARTARQLEQERLKIESRPLQSFIAPARFASASDEPGRAWKLGKPELFTAIAPKKPGDAPAKRKKKPTAKKAAR